MAGYIINQDAAYREAEATRHLMRCPGLAEGLLVGLGVPQFSWVAIELQTQRISDVKGDIDVIAGPMRFDNAAEFERLTLEHQEKYPDWHPSWHPYLAAKRVAEEGGITWPPLPDYLAGVEVKCAYFDGTEIRSEKSSPAKVDDIIKSLDRMLGLGLNKVALLDIIANHPADGPGSNAWLHAAGRSLTSLRAMQPALARRLPHTHAAAHWVWPSGAVVGADESMRGAGQPFELRPASPNPQADSPVRLEVNRRLQGVLASAPQPSYFPWVLVDCKNCHLIHLLDGCGSP